MADDKKKGAKKAGGKIVPREEPPADSKKNGWDRVESTQVDDVYLKMLREKFEKSEVDKRWGAEGAREDAEEETDILREGASEGKRALDEPPEPRPVARPDDQPAAEPQGPFSLFTDKTTQKLEEEIRKEASGVKTHPRLVPFQGDKSKGKGTSIYVLCGPDAGRTCYVSGKTVNVGRALDNDVVLKDISVSRKHCVLALGEDGAWSVEDLTSDNGTFLDGKPVLQAVLRPGQSLQIGRTIIIIEVT